MSVPRDCGTGKLSLTVVRSGHTELYVDVRSSKAIDAELYLKSKSELMRKVNKVHRGGGAPLVVVTEVDTTKGN